MTNINTFQGDVFIHEYIKHTGDDNTYFGFSGNDTIVMRTAGTDRFEINSAGNVSLYVNLTIPNYIYHAGDVDTYFGFSSDNRFVARVGGVDAIDIQQDGNIYIPNYLTHTGDTNTYFGFAANDLFEVVTNGSHSIKCNSDQRVDIQNFIRHISDEHTYFGFASDNIIDFYSNGQHNTRISAGNIEFVNTAVHMSHWLYHYGDSNTYFGFGAGDQYSLYTGGQIRFQVNSNAQRMFVHANQNPGGNWGSNEFSVTKGTQGYVPGIGMGFSGNTGVLWELRPGIAWDNLAIQSGQVQLQSVNGGGVRSQGSTVATSDDRLKTDESLIKNATNSLMKLKPQIYNKFRNLPNGPAESSLDDAGISYDKSFKESGLMVQDVYYDSPEFNHLCHLAPDATPTVIKPEEPEVGNLRKDPDYSMWGMEPSHLDYTGFIPYIIKSIQELNTDLPRHKTRIEGIPFSNISDYNSQIVSKTTDVRLSNVVNDKSVYGVISEVKTSSDDSESLVEYTGSGNIWVVNNSNIESGDYITTSNIAGYGTKQELNSKMNYTVAKSVISCDFTQPYVNEKRKIQELTNVNYWMVNTYPEITQTRYDFLNSNSSNIVTTVTTPFYIDNSNANIEITGAEYSNLTPDEQNTYTVSSETTYHIINTKVYDLDPTNPTSNVIVKQEYVDVLDENGQIQWENTGSTIPHYEIRYLDADGNITDEANTVIKAARIECTYQVN